MCKKFSLLSKPYNDFWIINLFHISFIEKGNSNHYFYGTTKKITFSDKLKKLISFFYK